MTKEDTRFLEINGEQVEVTEEVYKAYMQPEWREAKRRQRAYDDTDEIEWFFDMDFKQAPSGNGKGLYQVKKGLPLSLDQINEDSSFEPVSEMNVEEIANFQLMLEALEEILSSFSQRDSMIMELYLICELTEREIAEIVGCSQKTVNNVKKKILPVLQEEFEGWRD